MSAGKKPSALIEERSRAALQAAIDANPLRLMRLSVAERENLGLRLVVHEVLVWLDEQAAREQQEPEPAPEPEPAKEQT